MQCSLCQRQDKYGLYVPMIDKNSRTHIVCALCIEAWQSKSKAEDKMDMFRDIFNGA